MKIGMIHRYQRVLHMKEQLYTIPVTDSFNEDCECPLCAMKKQLEDNAIEYTMGPSYMEDDNRALTDKLGFCDKHIRDLYLQKNRLGLALMLKTHTDKTIKDLKELSRTKPAANSLFKKSQTNPVSQYVNDLESHCFVCDRINGTFNLYIDTLFHMWKKDTSFRDTFNKSKGFCTYHYGLLYNQCAKYLNNEQITIFIDDLNKIYFENMDRINDEIEWFIKKFDYRFANEPWKNSKDAIPRGIIKTNHTYVE